MTDVQLLRRNSNRGMMNLTLLKRVYSSYISTRSEDEKPPPLPLPPSLFDNPANNILNISLSCYPPTQPTNLPIPAYNYHQPMHKLVYQLFFSFPSHSILKQNPSYAHTKPGHKITQPSPPRIPPYPPPLPVLLNLSS